MEKIKVETRWGKFEEISLLNSYEGHYEVEFTFNGEHYYLVEDYSDKEKDLKVFSESEYLLAEEPEAMYRVHKKEEGRVPTEMFGVIYEAIKYGRKQAESSVAKFSL